MTPRWRGAVWRSRSHKKVKAGRLTFILVRGIGSAFVTRDVEEPELRAFLADEVKQ